MAPNIDSHCSNPTAAKTPAFSLDALIAHCRQKKALASEPAASPMNDIGTSKTGAFSLDALIAQCQKRKAKNAEQGNPISCHSSEIEELTRKLSLLQKARQQVLLKTRLVSEVVDEMYPDLSIARAVQKSNEKRTRVVRDTYGWRQYLGVWDMIEKANDMIKKEKADRLRMYDDLADELKTISKDIAAANLRLENATRKRSSEPELKEGELLESPLKKKLRSN